MREEVITYLRCPVCRSILTSHGSMLECNGCGSNFPVIAGVPVLINEANSLFRIEDFLRGRSTFFYEEKRFTRFWKRFVPSISLNLKSKANYARFSGLLLKQARNPRVLVIGGGMLGKGMDEIAAHPAIELVESDVSLKPRTALVCDAHDLPFADQSFDGVIAQAVLEHVLDPYRCVDEIHRVLKLGGIVYAETPFMQQVHGGKYDFTRFTYRGHRRLFRDFDEVASGAVAGPATALAWAYQYLLLSFVRKPTPKAIVKGFSRMTAFWLKYLDLMIINKPGALDAASAYFFIGQKTLSPLSDHALVSAYPHSR